MKAITIQEPFATFILKGLKHIETRSWATHYRGPIAIHAGKTMFSPIMPAQDYPLRGKVIATAILVDCVEMTSELISTIPNREKELGFYSVGRYAWILENVQPIDPKPARGYPGLWDYKAEEQANDKG